MTAPGAARQALVDDKIAAIRQSIEQAKARAVTMNDIGGAPEPGSKGQPAIDLAGLERVVLGVSATRRHLVPDAAIPGVYRLLSGPGDRKVAFRRGLLDALTPEVSLCTYGTNELDGLLSAAGATPPQTDHFEVGGSVSEPLPSWKKHCGNRTRQLVLVLRFPVRE